MARVSIKQPLEVDEEHNLLEKLFLAFASLGNWQEAEAFLSEFLTAQEVAMMAKRLELYKRTVKKEQYKRIIDDLNVTPQTVSIFRKKINRANVYFLRILRKFMTQDKRLEQRSYE